MIDQPLTLAANDFQLFRVPEQFEQDRSTLDARWKALQQEAHPDKFASREPAAQRLAMQWSVRVNEAYQRLKDPVRRGAYLCELRGAPVNAEDNTAMPADFLVQQMEWREALESATTASEVGALHTDVQQKKQALLGRLQEAIDVRRDFARAVSAVRALMFINRFNSDVDSRLDDFDAGVLDAERSQATR